MEGGGGGGYKRQFIEWGLISVRAYKCSGCGMKWDTACRPTNDPFWAFLSPGAQDPVQPQNNICLV